MFKSHVLYKHYKIYIENKNLSKGAKRLLLISEGSFQDFRFEYERNLEFKNKINDLAKAELRNNKIDDIFDDDTT
jgi:CRISPR/Cas system CMR-associated protein Cmr5 small subunit